MSPLDPPSREASTTSTPVAPAAARSSARRGFAARALARLRTMAGLVAHFARPGRFVLMPMLVVLLLAALLLAATGGLSYVAPFVYALF